MNKLLEHNYHILNDLIHFEYVKVLNQEVKVRVYLNYGTKKTSSCYLSFCINLNPLGKI